MKKKLCELKFETSYDWNMFILNVTPVVYFMREADENGVRRVFGIAWLCFYLGMEW